MRININKFFKDDRCLFLAYDQGLEHGPRDLNLRTVDPKFIFDIALEGMYTGVIVQQGLAEKYYKSYYKDVPLIVKLNGKTSISNSAPVSKQLCSVDRAIKLGASAVGYTIYPGSPNESDMLVEFSKIVDQAHDYGMPAIAWMYPRGPNINEFDTNVLAYSARIGLEIGADILKMKYNNDFEGWKWILKCAGRTRIMISGGDKMLEHDFIRKSEEIMKTGVCGMAVGRNVWQHDHPLAMSKALRKIIFDKATSQDAERIFEEEANKR